AGHITARSVVAFYQTQFDGILAAGENDRNGCRGRLRRERSWRAIGTNHRDLSAHEFPCERRQLIHLTFRPTIFDADIAVFNVAGLTQALAEGGNDISECPGRSAVEEPDHRQFWLRARCERPRGCSAAEQRDERAALHSITSSARTINVIGTWSPIPLAALRLRISSNFVGCSTGRLEGLAPRRILST